MSREINPNFELLVSEYIERFGGNYIGSNNVKRVFRLFLGNIDLILKG